MQYTPNYSNIKPNQQQPVQYLQKHITQLTNYINQNNQKYHKNMVTLKEFYQEQVQQLHDQKEDLIADNNRVNNQVITVRDLLANAHLRIKQLEEMNRDGQNREQELRMKLDNERKRGEGIYEQWQNKRRQWQKQIQYYNSQQSQLQLQNRRLSGQLQKQQTNVELLNKKKHNLQQIVDENYLLPDKIQDLQKNQYQYQYQIKELNHKNKILKEDVNLLEIKVGKLCSQNQSLRIFKVNANSEKKIDVQKAVKNQKEMGEGRVQKLEKENQGLIYQLNQIQSKMKTMSRDITSYQRQISKARDRIAELQSQIGASDRQKSDYISQFSSLKQQYDGVIQRLEDALIDYQNKNFKMQQQNKDLNDQLNSLQQLLNEVRAMNNIQVHRPQYRKMAQMQLMARRQQPEKRQQKEQQEPQQMDNTKEWQKLMTQLQKIAI